MYSVPFTKLMALFFILFVLHIFPKIISSYKMVLLSWFVLLTAACSVLCACLGGLQLSSPCLFPSHLFFLVVFCVREYVSSIGTWPCPQEVRALVDGFACQSLFWSFCMFT